MQANTIMGRDQTHENLSFNELIAQNYSISIYALVHDWTAQRKSFDDRLICIKFQGFQPTMIKDERHKKVTAAQKRIFESSTK